MADRFDSGGQGDLGIEAEPDSRHMAGAAGEAAPVPGAAVAPGTYVVSFTLWNDVARAALVAGSSGHFMLQ